MSDELSPPPGEPLFSADGKFMCTPAHAVEVAYMVSCAEGILMEAEGPLPPLEVGGEQRYKDPWKIRELRDAILDLIGEYIDGDASCADVMEQMEIASQEIFPPPSEPDPAAISAELLPE